MYDLFRYLCPFHQVTYWFFCFLEKEEKSLKANEIKPVLSNNLIKHSKLLFKLVSFKYEWKIDLLKDWHDKLVALDIGFA